MPMPLQDNTTADKMCTGPCTWPAWPLALLHESARCLALAAQRRLKLLPHGALDPDVFSKWLPVCVFPAVEALHETSSLALSFVVRLLQAADLLRAEAEWLLPGSGLERWLGQPPALQLLHLRQAWWRQVAWDAAALAALRLPAWLERRWPALITTTCTGVVACAAWTPTTAIHPRLERAGLLTAPGQAGNLPSVSQAVETAVWGVARFLLHFVLPGLGLVELAWRAEHTYLRATPEGRAWLQVALARRETPPEADHALELDIPYHELHFPEPDTLPMTITPASVPEPSPDAAFDLHVALTAPAACTFLLMHVTAPRTPEVPSPTAIPETARYRMTRATVTRGVAWGYPVREVLFFLARWNAGELPPDLVQHLWAWDDAQHTLTCTPGYLLQGDVDVLAALCRRKAFRRRARPLPGGAAAWVAGDAALALWAYLRRRGYVLQVQPPAAADTSRAEGAGRTALPVSALLIAAHAYQTLRTYLPRLADVPLAALAQAVESTLPPDERAAVQRLLASQEAILAQALQRTAPSTPEPAPKPLSADLASLARLDAFLSTAIANATMVDLTYIDTRAQVTHRRVKPLRIETRPPHRYLVAHCTLRNEERHFRLDRVIEVKSEELGVKS